MTQADLRDEVASVLGPFASRVSVFGSWARGDAGPDSDIDLLVRLRPPASRPPLGLRWYGIEIELADRLGRRVELVTEEALSPRLRPYIEKDLVVLYEE